MRSLQMFDDHAQQGEQRKEIYYLFNIIFSALQHVLWNFCELFTSNAIALVHLRIAHFL